MVENKDYIELLERLENMKSHLSKPHELPELDTKLDLGSKQDNHNQMFKYLHLQCLIHTDHFRNTQGIKCIYIIEGYLDLLKQQNPLAPYLFARTMLELVAFNYRVMEELNSIVQKDTKQWKSKGEQYFKYIVRARYATGDEEKLAALKEHGNMSKNALKPINIGECLRSLSGNRKYITLANRYGELCDYVHHNLSSQLICTQGVKKTDKFINEYGDGVITNDKMHYTVYGYPVSNKAMKAEKDTLNFMLQCSTALFEIVEQIPLTVYNESDLLEYTGNRFGKTFVALPKGVKDPIMYLTGKQKIDTYDMCPCGSLKKYKFCCMKKI